MLRLEYSNCNSDERQAKLYGLGDIHNRTSEGGRESAQAIDIVQFVHARFDPERGDIVLMEEQKRGAKFRGRIGAFPFRDDINGEGWDSTQLLMETDICLDEFKRVEKKVAEALATDEWESVGKVLDEAEAVGAVLKDTMIIQRNKKALIPSINRTLDRMEEDGKTDARIFVVAGMAHLTDDPELYKTLGRTTYNIYIDPQAGYLQRGRPQQPARPPVRRTRRGFL